MKVNSDYSNDYLSSTVGEKKTSPQDDFVLAKNAYEEAHKLTPDNIKVEDAWREMSDKEWDKLVEHVDKYLDTAKENLEKLKEMQEEAARKMAAEAPAGMKALFAAQGALKAAANGIMGDVSGIDADELEKASWTYEMETDDQVILAQAKMANEKAADMLTKSQELALKGDTSEGISDVGNIKETAKEKEDEGRKSWIITAFSDQGIICKECTIGGDSKELWSIEYKNSGDYRKVWDFLDKFDKNSDFNFAGNKSFWMDFLSGKISDVEIENTIHESKFY
ncbi:MAG: hypothetical protein MJ131_02820 [Lachnospiraceae bacterium]|nr:hypothetical protein [Lachnospiraceae bacterium]